MTPDILADLHAAAFGASDGPGFRAWSAAEFASLRAERGVFVCSRHGALARSAPRAVALARTGVPEADAREGETRPALGFALGRVVVDEAELLTLAVRPEARRRGLARALLAQIETEAARRGAREIFLEVAETNTAARRLYDTTGYGQRGRREGYYATASGARVAALVLSRPLSA